MVWTFFIIMIRFRILLFPEDFFFQWKNKLLWINFFWWLLHLFFLALFWWLTFRLGLLMKVFLYYFGLAVGKMFFRGFLRLWIRLIRIFYLFLIYLFVENIFYWIVQNFFWVTFWILENEYLFLHFFFPPSFFTLGTLYLWRWGILSLNKMDTDDCLFLFGIVDRFIILIFNNVAMIKVNKESFYLFVVLYYLEEPIQLFLFCLIKLLLYQRLRVNTITHLLWKLL